MAFYDLHPSYSHVVNQVIADDIPSLVRQANKIPSWERDDISWRIRPNTDYVVNRRHLEHAPTYTWAPYVPQTDLPSYSPKVDTSSYASKYEYQPYVPKLEASPRSTPVRESSYQTDRVKFFNSEQKERGGRSYPTNSYDYYLRPYSERKSVLLLDDDRSKPYYLNSVIPDRYTGVSSKPRNSEFPFRRYRSDFIPYAPYPKLYDSVKSIPNPDWSGYYGYRYRKARFIYDRSGEESSRAREIERSMRDARFRELCKGVYSSTYMDNIKNKISVGLETADLTSPDLSADTTRLGLNKSLEAETVVSSGEKQRKMTVAEKRRRNETLAIGLTNESLVKTDAMETKTETKRSSENDVKDEVVETKKTEETVQIKIEAPNKEEKADDILVKSTEENKEEEKPAIAAEPRTSQQEAPAPAPEPEVAEISCHPEEAETPGCQTEIKTEETSCQNEEPERSIPIKVLESYKAYEETNQDNTEPEAKEEAVVNIKIKTTEETIEKKDDPAEAVEKEVTEEKVEETIEQGDKKDEVEADTKEEVGVVKADTKEEVGVVEADAKEDVDDGLRQIPLKVLESYKAFEQENKGGEVEIPIERVEDSKEVITEPATEQEDNKVDTVENNEKVEEKESAVEIQEITEENEEPTSTNDDIEIKIVRVTTNGDSSNPDAEETTTETKSTINSDGTETIETIITETTRRQGDNNSTEEIVETVITTVIVKSDEPDEILELPDNSNEKIEAETE